jgi:hypothetical protein
MSLELFMNDVIIQPQRMKICTQCKTPKPATPEYFYRNKGMRDGMRNDCKECSRHKTQNAWYYNGGKENRYKAIRKLPHRTVFTNLRKNVKKKGKRKFLLGEAKTPEAEAYIKYLQTITHCPDCSKEVIWYLEGGGGGSASFDRIDSDGDYTKENVRIVCFHCNKQKSDSPVDEWVALLEKRIEKGILEEVDSRLIEFLCEEALNAGKG